VVTIIFCGFLWWSSDQYYSGIYRTTTNTKLKQATCSGHAIHPRPEGQGFPRIFDKEEMENGREGKLGASQKKYIHV
jgi:hypothetical protein